MPLQTRTGPGIPPTEPCSRATRRFATFMELRGLKEQTTLLKRVLLRLEKLTSHLQTTSPSKLATSKTSKQLQELALLLLNGKNFLVDPIQEQVLKAQRLLAPKTKKPPIFSIAIKEPTGCDPASYLEVRDYVAKALELATATQKDLVLRIRDIEQGKKRVTRVAPEEEETEEGEEAATAEGAVPVAPSAASSKKFKDFLESVKDRGWHVTETKKPVIEVVEETYRFDPTKLISEKEVSETLLLDEDTDIGLVRAPILVAINNSLTIGTLVRAAAITDVGYSIHHCYSKFYVIDGAICLGLPRDMVKTLVGSPRRMGIQKATPATFSDLLEGKQKKQRLISTRKMKRRIDIAKFQALIPFLQKEGLMYSDLLPFLSLSTLPYRVGHHYYCPFLPKDVATDLDFLIEGWTFLLKRKPKP